MATTIQTRQAATLPVDHGQTVAEQADSRNVVSRVASAGVSAVSNAVVPANPAVATVSGVATTAATVAALNWSPYVIGWSTINAAGAFASSWGLPAVVGRAAAMGTLAITGVPAASPVVTAAVGALAGLAVTLAGNAIVHLVRSRSSAEAGEATEQADTTAGETQVDTDEPSDADKDELTTVVVSKETPKKVDSDAIASILAKELAAIRDTNATDSFIGTMPAAAAAA